MKKDLKTFLFVLVGFTTIGFLCLSSAVKSASLKNDSASFLQSKFVKTLEKPSQLLDSATKEIKKTLFIQPKPLYEKEVIGVSSKNKTDKKQKETIPVKKPETPQEDKILRPPLKVLIIGDSLVIQSFGVLMEEKLLSYDGVEVYREGHYSTGLNRIDYYDWFEKTRSLIGSFKPDILIIFVGANDGQNIRGYDGSIGPWPSPQWDVLYRERIHNYLTEFSPQFKKIYWVGHPVPRTDNFNKKFSKMNEIYSSECTLFKNAVYINSWDRFTVNGVYSPTVADDNGLVQYVKASDGVHLTTHGGKILVDLLFSYMEKDIKFEQVSESSN